VGETVTIGLDMSAVLPPGIGLTTASISTATNTTPPVASTDFTFGPVSMRGRQAWCTISGGVADTDYQLTWILTDTASNVWPRTVLLKCANTA
jgi:hypothetical protein